MNARIVEIKRFAVHDGDGIRTTVFFKGCPLKCLWCHNPESIDFNPQLAYFEHKCINCGECVSVCKYGAHTMGDEVHFFDIQKCVACGDCAKKCLGDCLILYGQEMSVDEVMKAVLEDKDFYESSGGGVTLSGGECLMQADFCRELLKKLKENNIHTAIDTCGFVPRYSIDKVMPFTDIFLYDVKACDEDVHKKCTGVSNKLILDNLKYIDECGKRIEIRIPYVPDYNDKQIDKIAGFINGLQNVEKVKILPYHNYAGTKYKSLQMKDSLPKTLPNSDEIDIAVKKMKKMGINASNGYN